MTPPPLPVPPAPPNCELLVWDKKQQQIRLYNGMTMVAMVCFCGKCSQRNRPIIAAVAEVAWRKEAESYPSMAMKYGDQPLNAVPREVAYANARLWRAWGEAK